MLITRDIKLLSPLLAARMNTKVEPNRREFYKTANADGTFSIPTDLARWNWALLEARDALGLEDVAISAILPRNTYEVSNTSTYWRTFRRGRGEQSKEAFESISSGRVIQWRFTLSHHLPPGGDGGGRFIRPPDEEEFDMMLNHIGENLGMSEWGHAYLYGRFTIKKNERTNTEGPQKDEQHRSEQAAAIEDDATPDGRAGDAGGVGGAG